MTTELQKSTRKAKLIMVTEQNNNKFYDMEEIGDTIYVTYGRVGAIGTKVTYPSYKWDELYRSKTRKGYCDYTGLRQTVTVLNTKPIEDKEINDIVTFLISRAKSGLKNNYTTSYEEVTQAQIDEAQSVLNSVLEYRTKHVPVSVINDRLKKLYGIVPRKMKDVRDHLLTEFDNDKLKAILRNEQELLDNMATQVAQHNSQLDFEQDEEKTVLEIAGIQMTPATPEEQHFIREKLGANAHQFVRAFKIHQEPNETDFQNHLKDSDNKKTEMFWHGSRTENWWSILSTGLKIRPSNAVYTGSMFGDGLYFADKAQKSIGYTSLSNSYWAHGNDSHGFMCLYEVHVGKQKVLNRHDYDCYKYNKEFIKPYDSVFAKAGSDLRNNEYVVYDSHQCTPRFLVEISK